MNNKYRSISDFGPNTYQANNNPLSYCTVDTINTEFNHPDNSYRITPNSRPCQIFMAQYCSENWNDVCEIMANKPNDYYGNVGNMVMQPKGYNYKLNEGEILVRNTAARKYLVQMLNGILVSEKFDPLVPDSPTIDTYKGQNLIPIYAVNPVNIDFDPVMNKLVNNPRIGYDILSNIYNTMKRDGTLIQLSNTKLGTFFVRNIGPLK
jgi:hypothetical protein